jgi:hypothetical protein
MYAIAMSPPKLERDPAALPWLFPRRAGRCLMSVLTKTELTNSPAVEPAPEGRVSIAETPRSTFRVKPVRRDDEPLEEAFEDSEPPEIGARLHLEAPDAGEGHFYHDDRELKHGRSRG